MLSQSNTAEIVLASASPRRTQLLNQVGIAHRVLVADIDEKIYPDETAKDYVLRLAQAKSACIAAQCPHSVVLAADTIVVLGNQVLGKPGTAEAATQMLLSLSGQWHTVMTAFSIRDGEKNHAQLVSTKVKMTEIDNALLQQYIASGEPFDKAGAYGIQSAGAVFIEAIEGDFYTVVGLPLFAVCAALSHFGVSPSFQNLNCATTP